MPEADPGSFRDPASHVVLDGDRVLRLLDERGLEDWKSLSATRFFARAVGDGRLIESEPVPPVAGAAGTLAHPRLPFISYPYEWTFSMLKDAALLHLDLLSEALADGLTIKDATPYNIQFVDGRPLFIDVGSFERYVPGEAWIGYRQFTRQFLFPLILRAWAGLPFQPWLRGDMEGPRAADMRNVLSLRHRIRPAALLHITLQARMELRMSGATVRKELKTAGFSSDLILANIRRLRKLITRLEWTGSADGWAGYETCTHVGRDRSAKGEFLQAALAAHRPAHVVDLGANDCFFSEIVATSGAVAVAVDGDEPVLDAVYRRGSRASIAISDLTNPSPAQGWAGVERPGLFTRARPEMVIAYGLIHHLIYTASIPPANVISWLAGFGCPVVVEFVSPEDEMVALLTANKLDSELHEGRSRSTFEQLLTAEFEIVERLDLEGGTRTVFRLTPSARQGDGVGDGVGAELGDH